jgi:hypothetical protein
MYDSGIDFKSVNDLPEDSKSSGSPKVRKIRRDTRKWINVATWQMIGDLTRPVSQSDYEYLLNLSLQGSDAFTIPLRMPARFRYRGSLGNGNIIIRPDRRRKTIFKAKHRALKSGDSLAHIAEDPQFSPEVQRYLQRLDIVLRTASEICQEVPL